MKNVFSLIFINIFLLCFPLSNLADEYSDNFMNDFYEKRTKANLILKEIEIDLKNGKRLDVCKRQRKAANLGIEANDALKKAFKLNKLKPPLKTIELSNERWKRLYDNC
tara:strand:+ start:1349 stop:1675 length:327 start_codon:yes stop_codon:yes gene_type:complete